MALRLEDNEPELQVEKVGAVGVAKGGLAAPVKKGSAGAPPSADAAADTAAAETDTAATAPPAATEEKKIGVLNGRSKIST